MSSGDRRLLQTNEGTQPEAFHALDWALVATCAGIWGSSFLLIAIGLDHFEPGLVTFGRILFGAVALWLLPAARRSRIDRADLPRVALVGVCWMAFPLTMYSVAEQWIDSSLAGMLTAATPIWTALVATALIGRAPRGTLVAGLLVGFVGVVVLSWPSARGADASAIGVLLVVLATASYGIAGNVTVPLQQRYGSLPVLVRAQAVALVLTIPYAIAGVDGSSFDIGSLAAVVALGALGTGVAFVAAATLVGRVGATRGMVLTYLAPVVAIVLGVVFRDEVFDAYGAVGIALVLCGAYLASRAQRVGQASTTPEPSIAPASAPSQAES